MEKKLYRSKTNKKISGVCAGLAEYLGMDVTLFRVLWALGSLFLAGFGGVIAYIICALVIPEQPDGISSEKSDEQ